MLGLGDDHAGVPHGPRHAAHVLGHLRKLFPGGLSYALGVLHIVKRLAHPLLVADHVGPQLGAVVVQLLAPLVLGLGHIGPLERHGLFQLFSHFRLGGADGLGKALLVLGMLAALGFRRTHGFPLFC